MLVPPQLPPVLAAMFDLKPITGVPSPEDIKLVHDAIRALNNLLQTCYRERHPADAFPNDIVYTPPSLPAHIPIKLEPVVGPPSDNELKSAHTALRISDSFANVVAVFDEDLSMQLSQHVFDLQLARHIGRSSGGQPSKDRSPPQNRASTPTGNQEPSPTPNPGNDRDHDMGPPAQPGGTPRGKPTPRSEPNPSQDPNGGQPGEPSANHENERKAESQESTKVLVEIRDTLKDVIKVLVASQNSLARGFNSSRKASGEGYSLGAHSLINDKGEMPELQGLPTIQSGSWYYDYSNYVKNMSTTLLAQYFQFYGIGSELIEEGIVPSIKPGREEAARKLLVKRLYVVA